MCIYDFYKCLINTEQLKPLFLHDFCERIRQSQCTSKATATEGLRKTLLFGRGIRARRNQERDDRDTTVPLPLTGMSPLTRAFEIFWICIPSFYGYSYILVLLLFVEALWALNFNLFRNLNLKIFWLHPLFALLSLVSSPPSSCICAWFQSCSVGLTGSSFWMVYMQTLYFTFRKICLLFYIFLSTGTVVEGGTVSSPECN